MSKSEILIIDDERQIQKLLQITLEANDYKVREAITAKEGLHQVAAHPPDLILLDLGLPDMSGHEVLKKLREWYARPVIILTAQSGEEDIVTALDNGAHDYLVKPFRTGELLARIRSALRGAGQDQSEGTLKFNDLTVDLIARLVKKGKETIKLTNTEFNLLSLFVNNLALLLPAHAGLVRWLTATHPALARMHVLAGWLYIPRSLAPRPATSGPDELLRARRTLEAGAVGELEDLGARAAALASWTAYTGTPYHLAEDLAELAAVTPDSVQAQCRRWLAPTAAVTMIVNPEASAPARPATVGGGS